MSNIILTPCDTATRTFSQPNVAEGIVALVHGQGVYVCVCVYVCVLSQGTHFSF